MYMHIYVCLYAYVYISIYIYMLSADVLLIICKLPSLEATDEGNQLALSLSVMVLCLVSCGQGEVVWQKFPHRPATGKPGVACFCLAVAASLPSRAAAQAAALRNQNRSKISALGYWGNSKQIVRGSLHFP